MSTTEPEKKVVTCPKCGYTWETATDHPRVTCPACGANIAVPGNEDNLPPRRKRGEKKGSMVCPKCGYDWDPATKSRRLTCPWCHKSILRKKVK